jgi:hypothetical protein
VWSVETQLFASSSESDENNATVTLSGAPSRLRLRNDHATDGWQFWKLIATVNEVEQVLALHPNGASGASAETSPFYWMDGNGPPGTMRMREFALDWWWGYVFSMDLVNPVKKQSSPVITIKSSGICIDEDVMDRYISTCTCTRR